MSDIHDKCKKGRITVPYCTVLVYTVCGYVTVNKLVLSYLLLRLLLQIFGYFLTVDFTFIHYMKRLSLIQKKR
jgi:hypothetical protein